MHKTKLRRDMPFFDALKTTAVIGLLMQQTAALHCQKGPQPHPSFYTYSLFAESDYRANTEVVADSLESIRELTAVLDNGYSLLSASVESDRSLLIRTLDPEQVGLIELQLRGLEGAIKHAYRDSEEEKKHLLKLPLFVIAQARSAASKLNHLINQMTKPVTTFKSHVDMEGLQALANHGTDVFVSGRFH